MSKRICSHPECEKERIARGYCIRHYKLARKSGELPLLIDRQLTPEQRFWAKVDKRTPDSCWEWMAAKHLNGYGAFNINRKGRYAHRVSYEIAHGPIPAGMQVDHTCWNRSCVNPAHLRLATHGENQHNRTGATKISSSGVRGVSWDKTNKKWIAIAGRHGKHVHIGRFMTITEAEAAVVTWRRENMPYSLMDQAGSA